MDSFSCPTSPIYKNRQIENCFQGKAILYGQCHRILMKFDFLIIFLNVGLSAVSQENRQFFFKSGNMSQLFISLLGLTFNPNSENEYT